MMAAMELVKLITPRDRYMLDGLVYGPAGAQRGYIFIHGLESSAFSGHQVLAPLAGPDTQVLYFNNRGHDTLTGIKQVADTAKGYTWAVGGAAQEVFTDCTDDITSAVTFMKSRGAREIVLVGHSTGCQKAIYTMSQSVTDAAVTGVVLLCPMSDYAAMRHEVTPEVYKKAKTEAQRFIAAGKPMALLDESLWPELVSAQRWLSLYSGTSEEEVFPYALSDTQPEALYAVKVPILAIVAGADEYLDRSADELASWFREHLRQPGSQAVVVEGSLHNLKGHESEIMELISQWLRK